MRGRSAVFLLILALFVGLPVAVYLLGLGSNRPDHLAAARAAIERRDFTTARQELDAHLAAHPGHPDARFLAARTARRAGDGPAFEEHLKVYQEIGGDPQTAELERAMLRSQAGKVASADAVLRFASAHPGEPSVPFMLEALAFGLLKAGQPIRAIVALDRWLAHDPPPADRVQALVWRGEALASVGRAPEAAADHRKVLELDPGHALARLRLANFLVRDEPLEALTHLEQLRQTDPDNPDVLLGLARCNRQLGHHDTAGQFLARVRLVRPDDVAVLTEVGALALDLGRPADAETPLRRAVELAPTLRDPTVQLLRCLRESGKEAEAAVQQARLKQIDDEIDRKIEAMKGGP
jgi:predicted Zn-dependent protease